MKTLRVIAVTAVALLTLIIAGVFVWRTRSSSEAPRTALAEKSEVIQDVNFSGRLQPRVESTLGFEYSGTAADVLVREGDRVSAGQELVRIDDAAARLEVAQARASRLSSADQQYASWQKAKKDAELTAETNARTLDAKRQSVRDAKTELDQKKEYWLQVQREYGDDSSTTKTAYSTYLTAETAYHAAQQALETAQKSTSQSNQLADSAADIARKQYQATQKAAEGVAGLSSLEAAQQLAQIKVDKSVLTAPYDAVITSLDLEPGELIVAGKPVVTLATTDDVEIIASVPETDAVKIEHGQEATVTFDALPPTESWNAKVSRIAPAAVIVEGVPTYEVALTIIASDSRHRSGLTANVTVHTSRRTGVIAIPRRAVSTEGDMQTVRVWHEGATVEKQVTTGLTGSDGLIEITSGLSEGEQVVIESLK